MTDADILERLTEVFRDVFDNPSLQIGEATTARDVEGWDSIAHVSLIVATERHFGVSFTTKDIQALTCVGDLVRLIARRVR
jgi:acyl carrier protein